MKILCYIILFIGINTLLAAEIIPIIPQPKEYKLLGGTCDIRLINRITKHCLIDKPIENVLEEIKLKQVRPSINILDLILIIPQKQEQIKLCQLNKILPDESIGEEGYYLKILSDSILISANTAKGIFYGLQSLKQILESENTKKVIQCVWIKDFPKFKWRGVMDDISRGPVPTVKFVKEQIKRFAELKINLFMHYTEHVIKTNSHPVFAPINGNLTIADYKVLTEYAANYNISFVGNFQSFGHFTNILLNPKYSSLGESGTLISPIRKESYSFLKDVYSEMTRTFDATFFHVNCDETFDLGKNESKKLVDSIGYDKVYLQHIMKLRDILPKNTRMMLWGDVLLQHQKMLSDLPIDVVVCTWNYDSLITFSDYINPFVKSKHDLFISPGIVNSNRIFPDYNRVRKNIERFCKEGAGQNVLGVLLTVWDDGGLALFGNDWYGVAYSADKSWNTESIEFDNRFNKVIYGCDNSSITDLIKDISQISNQVPTFSMNDKVFWESIYTGIGRNYSINIDGWREVEKITAVVLTKFSNITVEKNQADVVSLGYIIKLYNVLAIERLGYVRFANLYSEAIQSSIPNKKKEKLTLLKSELKQLINNFRELRIEFEKVWFNENQPYTFSKIDSVYANKISSLQNILNKIENVSETLINASELPKPIDVGLGINVLNGKYFLEWLSVNPFQFEKQEDALQTNYFAQLGEERKIIPVVTQELLFNNKKHRWKRIVSSQQDKLDLNQSFPESPLNSATYLFANINSDSALTIRAELETISSIIIYLNGETIFNSNSSTINKTGINLSLKKGKNNLMFKTVRKNADWNLTFKVNEVKIVNQKNRYKVI